MSSSGYKRGLATAAVSALAITGVPFFAGTAHANPMEQQLPAGDVELYTPFDAASVKNDGVNQTIHLVANAGTGVGQVRFEYSTDNFATAGKPIATVSRANGIFSAEWAPPAGVYNTTVQIRATAISAGTGVDGDQDTNDVAISPNADSINISNAPGSELGVFDQPYDSTGGAPDADGDDESGLLGGVQGTTSDLAANPNIELSSPSGTSPSRQEDYRETVQAGDTVRDWSGPVDFDGYNWGTNDDADQALVVADLVGEDEDGEAVVLYKQTISEVTATATNPTVQAGGTTSATVVVKDQKGNPVVGAQVVRDADGDNVQDAGEEVKYTDSRGRATFTGLSGSANGTSHAFYVNTTDNNDYENGVDFRRTVTVTSYNAVATTLSASSADGNAFDFDENDADDIRVRVLDQNGNPVQGQNVSYHWTIDPFNANTPDSRVPASGDSVTTTDAQGYADIAFPAGQPAGTYTLHYYVNRDGTPGQQAGDLGGENLVVKAGQADIKWADGSVAQAQEGTTEVFEGVLRLSDGTPLPGRNLAISWTPGTPGGNSIVAAQGAQPAGTTRTSDTSATTTTGADGTFGVALTDPAPPAGGQADELNGTLTATTTNTPNIGNANDSSSLEVDWLQYTGPQDASDIIVNWDELIDNNATPGRPVDLDITVVNQEGTDLTDLPVEVSVNHGFLSPNAETEGDLEPDPAPAEGGLYGEWESLGMTRTLTTDDGGDTGIVVAIEDDELFQTQESVTTTVTIKVGNVTRTINIDFDSEDPLNPGELIIEQDDEQTVGVLPKAPTTESVFYNVFATDQFGNLVADEPVELTDDLQNAYLNGSDNNRTVWTQLADQGPALVLDSDVAGDQTPEGEWDTETHTWTDGDAVTAGFQPAVDADMTTVDAEGETVEWYTIDFAASTFTMENDADSPEEVGNTVIVTYKAVDQNGEPIANLDVGFLRTGPDEYQDGDFNSFDVTDEDGLAEYVFQGAAPGKATIAAIAGEFNRFGGFSPIGSSRAQTEVMFAGDDPTEDRETIVAVLTGENNGKKADRLTVETDTDAAGANVKLWRFNKAGRRVLMGTEILGDTGVVEFVVEDRNKRKFTQYIAKVFRTDVTKADKTNKRRVR